MILYTVKNGVYYNLEDFKEDLSDLGENGFPNKIYINMTNRSVSYTHLTLPTN